MLPTTPNKLIRASRVSLKTFVNVISDSTVALSGIPWAVFFQREPSLACRSIYLYRVLAGFQCWNWDGPKTKVYQEDYVAGFLPLALITKDAMCCLITSSTAVLTRVLSRCIAGTKVVVRDFESITLSFKFVNWITSTGNRQAKQTLLSRIFRNSRCLPQ